MDKERKNNHLFKDKIKQILKNRNAVCVSGQTLNFLSQHGQEVEVKFQEN